MLLLLRDQHVLNAMKANAPKRKAVFEEIQHVFPHLLVCACLYGVRGQCKNQGTQHVYKHLFFGQQF